MTTEPRRQRVHRYLGLTGTFTISAEIVFGALWIAGIVEWTQSRQPETSANLLMMILPFLAGTGLLHAARAGHLDLLLGAGVTRARIWRTAVLRTVAVPFLLVLGLASLLSPDRSPGSILSFVFRAAGAAAVLSGVAFAAGLTQPRHLAGTLWVGLRLAFLLSPLGRAFLGTLRTSGFDETDRLASVLALVVVPELLLDDRIPLASAVPMLVAGTVALVLSWQLLRRAEFAGRRAE